MSVSKSLSLSFTLLLAPGLALAISYSCSHSLFISLSCSHFLCLALTISRSLFPPPPIFLLNLTPASDFVSLTLSFFLYLSNSNSPLQPPTPVYLLPYICLLLCPCPLCLSQPCISPPAPLHLYMSLSSSPSAPYPPIPLAPISLSFPSVHLLLTLSMPILLSHTNSIILIVSY